MNIMPMQPKRGILLISGRTRRTRAFFAVVVRVDWHSTISAHRRHLFPRGDDGAELAAAEKAFLG
jgi:hypothetical protein